MICLRAGRTYWPNGSVGMMLMFFGQPSLEWSGTTPLDASMEGLGHAADGLGTAENLIDPLAVSKGQSIAFVSGVVSVDH